MSSDSLVVTLALASASLLAGLGFGFAYFTMLRRTVAYFGAGAGYLAPAALTLARIAAAVIFFACAARLGALPLLAGFLGFLLARTWALRAARRAG